ncbi:glutamate-1-semialdehyde 2,1-aminomutase [Chromatiales bacterium (ex Bugula neritina AB1)]|nr:glutamate-1-semialdehyde 2,1-aminomutase [Chromatiales bacterium (ex Bugula neritina AB1)]
MNKHWLEKARNVLPAGSLGNFDPGVFIREGKGSRVWDEDGTEYIDYLIGSGPMLLGHGHPEVLDAVSSQLGKGMTFFANNSASVELAEEICRAVPCAEQVRYVTSGGEADMYALRLARAYTGRNKILKFEGGYHGMSAEAQMSLAPTRLANFPQAVPDSAGIPPGVASEMLIAPFNDIESVKAILDEHENEVAAIIVEPLQRIVPPAPGFLQALRDECTARSLLLIFDEIVTGFRLAYGGAQTRYGVMPDICTLGKIIGGGFPLAAIGASSEIMSHFDKDLAGDRFLMQLGTLSGNPVAAVAGLKTMEILRRDGNYEKLVATGERLISMLKKHLDHSGHAYQVVGDPTLFDVLFTATPVRDYRSTITADQKRNGRFNQVLREHGIFKSAGKTYPSLAISEHDLQLTDAAIKAAANSLS